MPTHAEVDRFIADLTGRRHRLLAMTEPGAAATLVEELSELAEQLLVAEEELRVQQDTLDDTRRQLERLTRERDALWVSAATARVVTDLHGAVASTNWAADALTRRSVVRTTPRPIATWFEVEDRPAVRSMLGRAVAHQRPDPVAATVVGGDGVRTRVTAAVRRVDDGASPQLWWELLAVTTDPAEATGSVAPSIAEIGALARGLASLRDPREIVARIARETVRLVTPASAAGVAFVHRERIETADGTPDRVAALDRVQLEGGDGPFHDCTHTGATVLATDLASDTRWPHFTPRAIALGVGAVVAAPLVSSHDRTGVLLVVADAGDAFDAVAADVVTALGVHAGAALDRAATEANLLNAVASRQLIGEAVGIIVERRKVTSDQAFRMLVQASQNTNRKLRDIAQQVVDTGEDPNRIGTR